MDVNSFVIGYNKGKASAPAGGGVELNIAYGDTPPEDTSKLWVKANKPNNIHVAPVLEGAEPKVETAGGLLASAMTGFGAAAVGNKIYCFGGNDGTYLDTISVYDTELGTTDILDEKLLTVVNGPACAAVGTKIYLFGGYGGSARLKNIDMFDTETGKPTRLSETLAVAANNMGCAAVGTKIYLFGGVTGTSFTVSKDIYVFDTVEQKRSKLTATLPFAMFDMLAVSVGTKIYLFGGSDSSSNSTDKILVFDTVEGTVETLSERLPQTIAKIKGKGIGQKVYLFGIGTGVYTTTIYVFDTKTGKTDKLSATLPEKIDANMETVNVGAKIYLMGGKKSDGTKTRNINVFSASFPLSKGDIAMEESLTQNVFNLLDNVAVGIKSAYIGNEGNMAENLDVALYQDGEWENI